MFAFRFGSSAVAALCLSIVVPAFAALPQARLGSLFPPGGQVGTTFEVRVAGEQDLEYDTAPRLEFSRPDVHAEPVVDSATGVWQRNAFRVTIPADAPAGRCDAWLAGYYGASNPRSFRIESGKTKVEERDAGSASPAALDADEACYGQIESAADVDVFAFVGDAGRVVSLRVDAAEFDSPLRPVLELISPGGRRLGFGGGGFRGAAAFPAILPESGEYRVRVFDSSYRGGGDFVYRLEVATHPVVTSVWPPAGVAGTTTVFDLFGYNLPGGEPVADSAPLVRRSVEIALPADPLMRPTSLVLGPSQSFVNGFDYRFREGATAADVVPIFFASRPLVPETEPNDGSDEAQRLTVPADVAGRFEPRRDADRYLFDAKAGEIYFLEVFAHRSASQADAVVSVDQVTGPDGKPKERQIAVVDDVTAGTVPGVFDVTTDDPLQRFEVPDDGTYRVTLRDRYFGSRGGVDLAYRLSIRRPEPDFRLIVIPHLREKPDASASPWSLSLRRSENVALTVYALRRDGFAGPIAVTVDGLPSGVTTNGVTIAAGQTSAPLVFVASDQTDRWHGPVRIFGDATLPAAGETSSAVRREALIGTVVRGGEKTPLETRLAASLVLSVLADDLPFRLAGPGGTMRVPQGGQVLLPVRLARKPPYAETVTVSADGLATEAKVTAEPKAIAPGEEEHLVRLLVDPLAPAQTHHVLLRGSGKIDYSRDPFRFKRAKASQAAAALALTNADDSLNAVLVARDAAKAALAAIEVAAKEPADPTAVDVAKALLAEQETAVGKAEEHRKRTAEAKVPIDAAVAAAEQAAAPQKVDYVSAAPVVTLTVVPAEIELTLSLANGGQLKRGGTIDVKVTAKRRGYTGPIRLEFRIPPGAGGVEGEPTTIPANELEATIRITAAADAAEGDIPFPAIRAMTETADAPPLDVPIALKVIP